MREIAQTTDFPLGYELVAVKGAQLGAHFSESLSDWAGHGG